MSHSPPGEPDAEGGVDELTREVVTDTLKRYRGVAVSVVLLLFVIAVVPTRSPAVVPFTGFAAGSADADDTTELAPASDSAPSPPVTTTTMAATGTTGTSGLDDTTGTTPTNGDATAITTTTVGTSPSPTTSTTTPSTTTTTAPPGQFPDCLIDGSFCQ